MTVTTVFNILKVKSYTTLYELYGGRVHLKHYELYGGRVHLKHYELYVHINHKELDGVTVHGATFLFVDINLITLSF